MAYMLSNSQWQNLNQTIYQINKEEDISSFLFHVMKHLNLLCPYSCGIFNLARMSGSGPKIYHSSGVNLLPEDTDSINRYGLANNPFIRGICMLPGGSVSCGFSRDQFTESQRLNFRSTVIPQNPNHALTVVLYHETELLGFILLMRRDGEAPFSDSNICAMDTIRHHIALQLHKVLRSTLSVDSEADEKSNFEKQVCEFSLTRKELEVLWLISTRHSDEKICQKLFVTQSTLKKHLSHIYHKMSVKNRIELLQLLNCGQQKQ